MIDYEATPSKATESNSHCEAENSHVLIFTVANNNQKYTLEQKPCRGKITMP